MEAKPGFETGSSYGLNPESVSGQKVVAGLIPYKQTKQKQIKSKKIKAKTKAKTNKKQIKIKIKVKTKSRSSQIKLKTKESKTKQSKTKQTKTNQNQRFCFHCCSVHLAKSPPTETLAKTCPIQPTRQQKKLCTRMLAVQSG